MPEKKPLLGLLGLILGVGLFVWISVRLLEQSQSTEWPPLPAGALINALLLALVARGLHGIAWAVGARQYADKLGWAEAVGAYSISFLARYIPGKIWQIGGLSVLTRNRGANPLSIAGYSLVFLVAFQVIGVLVLGVAYLLRDQALAFWLTSLSAPVIAVLLALLYQLCGPSLLQALPAKHQEKFTGVLDQRFWPLTINLTLLALTWVMLASSGYQVVKGFSAEWSGTWGQSSVAIISGHLAGFVVLVAPSGVGVRESTIALLLTGQGVMAATAIAIVVAFRIVLTIGELIWAGAGMLIALRKPGNRLPD
ncbi:MAG: hypothetical protein QNJ05_14025 [Woeseiaceae bacterium]|nr:hypothetical protein [Woeseiaceae bacterium]